MEIIKYSENWKSQWDDFVLHSNNGTMFHLQKFFDYHPSKKFSFNHLIFLQKGKIIAALPGQLKDGVFESPIGASFGSIVTGDIRFGVAMNLVSALLEFGKNNGIEKVMLTSAPTIYETIPNQNLDFAMLWRGFRYDTHYISSAIQLDKNRDIIERFQSTVRNGVRKSLRNKSLRVEINDRLDEFYPIISENLDRHKVKPTHSYEDLIKLQELLPNRLKLFLVYFEEKPIGGSLIFSCNANVVLCFYNMMLYEFAELKPIHRVMYEVIKYATDKDYRYVDIGVSQDTAAENPMTPNTSLIEFKETFDAKAIMRNTLSINL